MKIIKTRKKSILAGTVTLLLVLSIAATLAWADDDDDDDDREYKSRNKDSKESSWFVFKKRGVVPVTDKLYLKECGSCHFAYQPGLLPSGSWAKVMNGLEDHFGENATLAPEDYKPIYDLLQKNAAEFSNAKRSYKIVRSLNGRTPLRITETPYIIRKHDEISQRVLDRKSIKTLGNCSACHQSASEGSYDDDSVKIPKN